MYLLFSWQNVGKDPHRYVVQVSDLVIADETSYNDVPHSFVLARTTTFITVILYNINLKK